MLLQETVNFDVRGMWENMGWAAKLVVILLFFMSEIGRASCRERV